MARKTENNKSQVVGFVGVGLDNDDEEQRITRSEYFFLVGGSADTHEHMQDTAIRFEELLDRRGKRLTDAEVMEAIDLLREALES